MGGRESPVRYGWSWKKDPLKSTAEIRVYLFGALLWAVTSAALVVFASFLLARVRTAPSVLITVLIVTIGALLGFYVLFKEIDDVTKVKEGLEALGTIDPKRYAGALCAQFELTGKAIYV
jgi:hypothetical protein